MSKDLVELIDELEDEQTSADESAESETAPSEKETVEEADAEQSATESEQDKQEEDTAAGEQPAEEVVQPVELSEEQKLIASYGGLEEARRRLSLVQDYALGGDDQSLVRVMQNLHKENPVQYQRLVEGLIAKHAAELGYSELGDLSDDELLERLQQVENSKAAIETELARLRSQVGETQIDEEAQAFGDEVGACVDGLLEGQKLHPEAEETLKEQLANEVLALPEFARAGQFHHEQKGSGAQQLAMLGLKDAIAGLVEQKLSKFVKISNALYAQEKNQAPAKEKEKSAVAAAMPSAPSGAAKPEIGTDHIKQPRVGMKLSDFIDD